jgi:hypothetical protein
MNMIEFDTINAIITEAGVDPNDVGEILIQPNGIVITLYVRVPREEGSDIGGQLMLHNGDVMVTKRVYEIHRADDHVHEDGTDIGHVHDVLDTAENVS